MQKKIIVLKLDLYITVHSIDLKVQNIRLKGFLNISISVKDAQIYRHWDNNTLQLSMAIKNLHGMDISQSANLIFFFLKSN